MAQQAPIADAAALRALLAEDDALRDLVASMDAVKLAVETVWRENHQPWFTDHGPRHSSRTADYALLLGDLPRMHSSLWLTPLEAYILWAAAWLHDVGMQDMLAAASHVGQIDEAGFGRVRHQHPHRSSERILENWTQLGLPQEDAALAEAVASVARAHGTGFYADTVKSRLAGQTTVRNQPVRARLLAALLLFADELDLHYERASGLAGWGTDNSVSEAHNFKHRSVRSVAAVREPDGGIAVALELVFSARLEDADRLAVQRWIEVKLRRQMSLIEPEIEEGFGGQARLDRVIRTGVGELRAHAPLPSDAALAIIRAETARDELVNHTAEFERVKLAIAHAGLVVVSDGSPDPARDDGAGDLLDAACADAAAWGRTVCLSRRPRLSSGATAADIVGEWASALGMAEPPANQDENVRRCAGLAALLAAVSPHGRRYLFAVARAQDVDRESLQWLQREAVPALRSACGAAFLLTAGVATPFAVAGEAVVSIALGPTDQQASAEYLGRFVARGIAMAESQAMRRYALIKETAQHHELQLRGRP